MDYSLLLLIFEVLLLGALSGAVSGLLGIGGGSVMVPGVTLILLGQGFGVDESVKFALGTSLATAFLTTAAACAAHYQNSMLKKELAAWLAPFMLVGALIGSGIATQANGWLLSIAIGIYNCLIGMQMHFTTSTPSITVAKSITKAELSAVGTSIGALSATFGIGGGSITVPYLTFRGGYTAASAAANSAVCAMILCLGGTVGYMLADQPPQAYSFGYVHWLLVAGMALTGMPAARAIANMVPKLKDSYIKNSFISYMFAVGVIMVVLGILGN